MTFALVTPYILRWMVKVTNYLTRRQQEILDFIGEFLDREGLTPTHREICERFGYSSCSSFRCL